jgi:hypothetical protein
MAEAGGREGGGGGGRRAKRCVGVKGLGSDRITSRPSKEEKEQKPLWHSWQPRLTLYLVLRKRHASYEKRMRPDWAAHKLNGDVDHIRLSA